MGYETYMKRCLILARQGLGLVAPNPMVGCVIVKNKIIIGEGYHHRYGGSHAEINAINSVKDKSMLAGSTLYVNLEPCSHYGKTPPCSEAIINNNIGEVVVGSVDPNPLVAGAGIARLKASGIKVNFGILDEENKELNRRFFTFHQQQRPYIILKWAQTSDGFLDRVRKSPTTEKPVWITNEMCRILVHKWRTEESAFMVGANTVLLDNPMLTARSWFGKQPLRITIDAEGVLSKELNIFNNKAPTLLFSSEIRKGIDTEIIDWNKNIANQITERLYQRNIASLVVEGGRKLIDLFIQSNLWDEARVFSGPAEFGQGVPAPEITGDVIREISIGNSILRIIRPAK
ncbi:MAG TPA: bifunctional diaminohydroxyphosphoribosylaminopyrimidine deaminase/5-amino-6-(5-phosphoribosylamino)uracil reductase RibD [Bacteroidales bacterium]|nr:bifunctional diaminohydroxyphosphoribosylaminopyrimidine deaminase/5-amino-6-(5-phosphoribosylamino)uracil reductase RibD [Bacteroidales bacterium]